MMVRLENVIRSTRTLLRGAYPGLVTALAAALLVLLLWPQPERTFVAEAIAAASTAGENPSAADVHAWLKSDEVLRATVTNLRSSQPREVAEFLSAAATSDPIAAIRERVVLVSLASPDELPRVSIGCQAPRRRAALAVADELARQLAEHHPAQSKRAKLASLAEREQQASAELKEAQGSQERLTVELQGLRHAHLASAVASAPAAPAATPAAPATDRPSTELSRTLESLKLERDRLLEIYLPAHPQIQSLSAQISRLEESLRRSAPKPELHGAAHHPANESLGDKTVLLEWRRGGQSQDVPASGQKPLPTTDSRTELTAAIQQTQLDLLAATHRRQQAEQAWQSLNEQRQKIESAGDFAWQIQPAQIVTTGGENPARNQLATALIAATIGGLGIGWLAARDTRLTTAAELRSSVALPVLATLSSGDSEPLAEATPSPAQRAVQMATRCAEVVLATFVLTLLAAIALDRGLMGDLTYDPLATLGELVQRLV
ncbi:MAG TPA: hypothetical protein VMP01_25620 [Pirellulaceae bacterium]|nr:hypothetical protein [Pirellulaceae bacterium]